MPQWRNRLQRHKGKPNKSTLSAMMAGAMAGVSLDNPVMARGRSPDDGGTILHPSLRKRWEFRSGAGEREFYWCLATGPNGVIYHLYGNERNRILGFEACMLEDYPNPPVADRPPSLTPMVEMDFRSAVDRLLEAGFVRSDGPGF